VAPKCGTGEYRQPKGFIALDYEGVEVTSPLSWVDLEIPTRISRSSRLASDTASHGPPKPCSRPSRGSPTGAARG
jgi:hypothetical protein